MERTSEYVGVYATVIIKLPQTNRLKKYTVGRSKLHLYSNEDLKVSHDLKFEISQTPPIRWSATFRNIDRSWNDSITMMRLTLYINRDQGEYSVHLSNFDRIFRGNI